MWKTFPKFEEKNPLVSIEEAASGLYRLRLACDFLPLDVGGPAPALFDFVILFAHKSLYFPATIQLFSKTMLIRFPRFNTYLLALVSLAGLVGCRTPEERARDKAVSALRLYLEANPDGTGHDETVEISGVSLVVSKSPFLDEGYLDTAAVVDTVGGGFAIQLQYGRHGTLVLDSVTAERRGSHCLVFAQFGSGQDRQARWLAAPLINRRITNGYLIFTPAATREEAEQIVLGLNNVIKKLKKSSRF